MDKICYTCKISKSVELFHRKKEGYHSQCKDCRKKYFKKYNLLNKVHLNSKSKIGNDTKSQWFKEYKSTLKCIRCGESNPLCLEFHHKDPTQKDRAISTMTRLSPEKVKEEIAKCDVLCANCHRKLHGGNTRNPIINQ